MTRPNPICSVFLHVCAGLMTSTVCANLARKDRDCRLRPCYYYIFSDSGKKASRKACNGTLCRYAFMIKQAMFMPGPEGIRRGLTICLFTNNNDSCSVVRDSLVCDTFAVIYTQVVIYDRCLSLQTSGILKKMLGGCAAVTVVKCNEVLFVLRRSQLSGLKIAKCCSQPARMWLR